MAINTTRDHQGYINSQDQQDTDEGHVSTDKAGKERRLISVADC